MCGIVGIYSNDSDAPTKLLSVLEQLEHRGGDGVGVAAMTAIGIRTAKGHGKLKSAYQQDWPTGSPMIGHTRYRTEGERVLSNVQPLSSSCGQLVLAHNGELTNADELRVYANKWGITPTGTSDSNAMVAALTVLLREESTIEDAVFALMDMMRGSYSVVMLVDEQFVVFRDPYGNRPLFFGEVDGGYMVASEDGPMSMGSPVRVRSVLPGECIIVSDQGMHSTRYHTLPTPRPCSFECVYFSRPDTAAAPDRPVSVTRHTAGRRLWSEHPVVADGVVPVPDSSIDAAVGFAKAAGLELLSNALIKNRGRSFIAATQQQREAIVRDKFNPISRLLSGKRVVLVDDSIVRGTTMRTLVQQVRDAGAVEVHVRVASPPVRFPCYYGIDMKTEEQLIAANRDVEAVRYYIGADSLGYVSVRALIEACGGGTHCTACFTGDYQIPR